VNATYPSAVKLQDAASRLRKAKKIRAVLQDALGADLGTRRCLDVGCSSGMITRHLTATFGQVVGVDSDWEAVRFAAGQATDDKPTYVAADAAHLPFRQGVFDVLVCAQVYEHIADQTGLASELWRVMADDGACFFSGPNRLSFIEEHYGLPLVSWLPRSLADRYLHLARRAPCYEERPRTYWSLRRLLSRFIIQDYTMVILTAPDRFACQEELGRFRLIGRLPRFVLRGLLFLMPNYNWVLRKRNE
jgi:SAM-dependent methyltransferase